MGEGGGGGGYEDDHPPLSTSIISRALLMPSNSCPYVGVHGYRWVWLIAPATTVLTIPLLPVLLKLA